MLSAALFAFLHHIMAFTFVAALVTEFVSIRDAIDEKTAKRLVVADALYAASATLVLIVGFIRVYYFEKGADYYWQNIPFITKLCLFVIIAVLSFYPSVEFLKWKKSLKAGVVPSPSLEKLRIVKLVIHIELGLLLLLILNAALMAKGVGFLH